MFMDNPEIAALPADRFFQTGFVYAVRLGAQRMVREMEMDHAGPKERKVPEKRLRQLEREFAVLQEGVEHRVLQMALIIHAIHFEGLYRLRNQTFDEYLRKQCKWVRSRQRAYQLLDYGRTIRELTTHVDTLPTEAQVRKQLAKLPRPDRLPSWKQALQTSTIPGRVTMAHLKKVVDSSRVQIEPPSHNTVGEKAKVIAILERWTKRGHRNELHEIMRECERLLQLPDGI
jgi:hypothetical protein